MTKDRRYKLVKDQISGGHLKSLRDIFEIIPKTVVLKDMKIHNLRFNELLRDVSLFLVKELFHLAELIEVDEKVILDLTHNQYIADKKSRPKKEQKSQA